MLPFFLATLCYNTGAILTAGPKSHCPNCEEEEQLTQVTLGHMEAQLGQPVGPHYLQYQVLSVQHF